MSGKGDGQRPRYVSDEVWFENWNKIYGKKAEEKNKGLKSKLSICATGEVIKKDEKKI
jgi:hypothetical protein